MAEEVFYAKVIEIFGRTGSGGCITSCKVELMEGKRTLNRCVAGPVAVGDILTLLECEREHRVKFNK